MNTRANLLRLSLLVCSLSLGGYAQNLTWPQFRGPHVSPTSTNARLADRWSKTENVEWSQDIPGRGSSSSIITGGKIFLITVTTESKSKPPQIGTEYSNEYVAGLQKQGLRMKEILAQVNARDIEMPHEVKLHYFLYCLNRKTVGAKFEHTTLVHSIRFSLTVSGKSVAARLRQ